MGAVSGTVEEGETFDGNIVKETEEEIGLTGVDIHKERKYFIDDGSYKYFVQKYSASVDKDATKITIQEDEVEGYAWIRISELINDVRNNPDKYVPSMMDGLKSLGLL